jgi:short-subunit dehydrogenase
MQINFIASSLAITNLIPYLKNKKESAIVNITAGMVYVPLVMYPMYNATKAALHSFIISAREQVKNTSIQIIEVAPPMVATKLTEGMEGKRVSPEIIANAVIDALVNKKENILVGQVKSLVFMGFVAWLLYSIPPNENSTGMANFEIAKPTKLPPDGFQCYAKTTLFYPSRQSTPKNRESTTKA